jgi:thioredoxin reductase (NADPH)
MTNQKIYDCIMIGAGPSALSASIYTTREDISTLLIERGAVGGLAAITDWVDNYPGYSQGISGLDLANQMESQATRFGATYRYADVTSITKNEQTKLIEIKTDDGDFLAKSALIATGTHYRELGIPGEKELYGRGVHFCATCDGAFYKNKKLIVVGGGNSAIQEGMFLTKFASHIDLLVRGDKLRASEVLQEDLKKYLKSGQITIHFNTSAEEIVANKEGKLDFVKAKKGGESIDFKVDGVFVFIGLDPNTSFLSKEPGILDEYNFIKTDSNLETCIKGVFASGDCRAGATMQIASATGEGATAALMIRKYLEENFKKD